MTNLEIAQLISERIGDEPIPFNSVHDLCEQTYNDLGGDPAEFDNVYEILLRILPLIPAGSAEGHRYNADLDSLAEGVQEGISGVTYALATASGIRSHAEGIGSVASGEGSHAEGKRTTASGGYAHSEGYCNGTGAYANITAKGFGSHAEGCIDSNYANITASGWGSHAEGYVSSGTIYAINNGAHAEGNCSGGGTITASGPGAHAEGNTYDNGKITSSSEGSHAEGYASNGGAITASSEGSHAGGFVNGVTGDGITAKGLGSFAHGYGSINTKNLGEHAIGAYNVSHRLDENSALGATGNSMHTIGVGTTGNDRKNAIEVMQNGDVYINGIGDYDGVHIKGETGATSSLKTLQEVIASLEARIAALGG